MCDTAQTGDSRCHHSSPLTNGVTKNGGGDLINEDSDDLWLAFEALAKTYPHDEGVRLTAHLGRRLVEDHRRLHVRIPAVMEKVVHSVLKMVELSPTPPDQQAARTKD